MLSQCNQALSNNYMGSVLIHTIILYSKILAKLAIGLEKHPELIIQSIQQNQSDSDSERVTLVEASGNTIRDVFLRCLNDRSGDAKGLDPSTGAPAGRKLGMYAIANIASKLFFHCKKLRNAEMMFHSIEQATSGTSPITPPALQYYPAAQRVTYLYYLGRYFFANNFFYFAQRTLQGAYVQCHRQALSQRRKILIYLILSNILLGRFPSQELLSRPEAVGLADHFVPICQAIQRGDITSFQYLVSLPHSTAKTLYRWRAALQYQTYGHTLVQRTLARRTFLLAGVHPEPGSKQAPNVALKDLQILQSMLERRAIEQHRPYEQQYPSPFWPSAYTPPTSALAETNGNTTAFHKIQSDPDSDSDADKKTHKRHQTAARRAKWTSEQKELAVVESDVAMLVQHGYLHGYLSHRHGRFAVMGAKNATKSVVEIGFPRVWDVNTKAWQGQQPPGWIQK
jgi:nuclear mRNA export protein PCID2/THP1